MNSTHTTVIIESTEIVEVPVPVLLVIEVPAPIFVGSPVEPSVEYAENLTAEQRKALFAIWREVAPEASNYDRYRFTRAVLGLKSPLDVVSWSENKFGAITTDEASRLLNVLRALAPIV